MNSIVLPMCVLALWTLIVLLLVGVGRIRALRTGRARMKDFRTGESANVPEDVALRNRAYVNLLELPVLFYAACLTLIVSNHPDPAMLTLAWIFVAARIVHTCIQLIYNNVLHRFLAFAIGYVVLAAMWLRLIWAALSLT